MVIIDSASTLEVNVVGDKVKNDSIEAIPIRNRLWSRYPIYLAIQKIKQIEMFCVKLNIFIVITRVTISILPRYIRALDIKCNDLCMYLLIMPNFLCTFISYAKSVKIYPQFQSNSTVLCYDSKLIHQNSTENVGDSSSKDNTECMYQK